MRKFGIGPIARSLIMLCSACLVGGTLLVAGCGQAPQQPIRIGINFWPGYEFLYLAEKKGFFQQEEVAVELIQFSSMSDARRAFERGQVDAMTVTLIEVLQSRELSNRSAQVFLVTDFSDGADVILVSPAIKNVAGLRGKRVALEVGSLNVYVLARALEKAGMTIEDVRMISMDQLSMEDAFVKREVDAVVTYPPVSVNLMKKGIARMVFSSKEIPGEVVDVVAVDAEFLSKRREDAARIARAFDRAVKYAAEQPEEAYRIMAAREKISPEEFRAALEGGIRVISLDKQAAMSRAFEQAVKTADHVLRQTGQLKGPDRTSGVLSLSAN